MRADFDRIRELAVRIFLLANRLDRHRNHSIEIGLLILLRFQHELGNEPDAESTCLISKVPSVRALWVQMLSAVRDVIEQIPDQLSLHLAARLRHVDPQHSHRLEREFQTPDVAAKNRGRGHLRSVWVLGSVLGAHFRFGMPLRISTTSCVLVVSSSCSSGAIVTSTPGASGRKSPGSFGSAAAGGFAPVSGRQLCGCRCGLCVGSRADRQAGRLRLGRVDRAGAAAIGRSSAAESARAHGPAMARTVAATNKASRIAT